MEHLLLQKLLFLNKTKFYPFNNNLLGFTVLFKTKMVIIGGKMTFIFNTNFFF